MEKTIAKIAYFFYYPILKVKIYIKNRKIDKKLESSSDGRDLKKEIIRDQSKKIRTLKKELAKYKKDESKSKKSEDSSLWWGDDGVISSSKPSSKSPKLTAKNMKHLLPLLVGGIAVFAVYKHFKNKRK